MSTRSVSHLRFGVGRCPTCGDDTETPSLHARRHEVDPEKAEALMDAVCSAESYSVRIQTIKAVTADVARSLVARWYGQADRAKEIATAGGMCVAMATVFEQCAKELDGLCDLAVTVTLPNDEGS